MIIIILHYIIHIIIMKCIHDILNYNYIKNYFLVYNIYDIRYARHIFVYIIIYTLILYLFVMIIMLFYIYNINIYIYIYIYIN